MSQGIENQLSYLVENTRLLNNTLERIAKALESSRTHEELEICDCHDCLTARAKRFEAKHPPETDSLNDPVKPTNCHCQWCQEDCNKGWR